MNFKEKWIWIPQEKYPDFQSCKYNGFNPGSDGYCVAEFKRCYTFDKKVISAKLRFSADTAFRLWVNGKMIASGPPYSGGDFLGNDKARSDFYALETEICPDKAELDFFARVKLMPTKICEYSKGCGGFMLSALLTFDDGEKKFISTDSTWSARRNASFVSPVFYDGNLCESSFVSAEETKNIWHCKTAPIKLRDEFEVFPENNLITLNPHEKRKIVCEYDKVYGGSLFLKVRTDGIVKVETVCSEISDDGGKKNFIFCKNDEFVDFETCSAGKILVTAENCSDNTAQICVGMLASCYPANCEAVTNTSDEELNKVLKVCAHSLKYCRQLMHLDSPRHCEPLACTGDYYVESLMTAFSFGDLSLAEFDILRTAQTLRDNDGRMFHTTYSLIWVLMLKDVYMFTGHKSLLEECEDALVMLINRFDTYLGENGILETPPDYMFVDWIYVDGFSMHHPPKALGQTSLNAFYFAALSAAEKIYIELGEEKTARCYADKKRKLKSAVNKLLFDEEKGLYFDGLNTPTPNELIGEYMPQNTDKRYYMMHSNILASCFGLCEEKYAKDILEKVMSGQCSGDIQPYFTHFLLEAVFNNDLCEKYTLKILNRWKNFVKECDKGLPEGFIPPDDSYTFDRSHAWGGTPLYSFPKAVCGFKILEAGMRKIELSPNSLGLEYVKAEIPTPYGNIVCIIRNGETVVSHPKEITIIYKDGKFGKR